MPQAWGRVADTIPLEGEVRRDESELKYAVAELLLDKRVLQAVVAKNGEPAVATAGGRGDALGSCRYVPTSSGPWTSRRMRSPLGDGSGR